jgi:hypothetical protein
MADLTITAGNVVVADPKPRVLYGSCGETITAGQAVYIADATKKWMRADSNSPEAEVRKADIASDATMGTDTSYTDHPTDWDDITHPSAAGHALLEPYYRAIINALP